MTRGEDVNTISKSIIAVAAALVMIGCAGKQEFKPAERAIAQSPEGYQAALYQIAGLDGILGTAKVWSMGTSRRLIQGQERAVVQVAFEIQNHSNQPLTMNLDELSADLGVMDRRIIEDVQPAMATGSFTIEAKQTRRIDIFFPLPMDINPQQVDAFQVKWKLHDTRLTYSQKTPFIEDQIESYAYYYTPYYDPFLYDHYMFHPRLVVYRYPFRHVHVLR